MAIRKNPDWHVWLSDVWYWISSSTRNMVVAVALVCLVGLVLFSAFKPSIPSTSRTISIPGAYRETACSNRAKVDVLTATSIQVRDADDCFLHFGVVGGMVELSGPNGTKTIGPGEERTVPDSFTIRMARATSGKPTISHTSCDLNHNPLYDGQNCTMQSTPLCLGIPPTSAETLGPEGWVNINHCEIGVAVAEGSPPILLIRANAPPVKAEAGVNSNERPEGLYEKVVPEGKEARWFHIECEPGKWIVGTWRCKP